MAIFQCEASQEVECAGIATGNLHLLSCVSAPLTCMACGRNGTDATVRSVHFQRYVITGTLQWTVLPFAVNILVLAVWVFAFGPGGLQSRYLAQCSFCKSPRLLVSADWEDCLVLPARNSLWRCQKLQSAWPLTRQGRRSCAQGIGAPPHSGEPPPSFTAPSVL